MKSLFFLFCVFAVKVYADCWSESLGYPCCSDKNTKVAVYDKDGNWGIENNEWCGIPKTSTKSIPTTGMPCPTYTVTYDLCMKNGGHISRVTVNGCPRPTCILPSTTTTTTTTQTKSTKVIPTTGMPCPTYTVTYDLCMKNGGHISRVTVNGCPRPTCILPSTTTTTTTTTQKTSTETTSSDCWSESLGYPCCSDKNTNVIYYDKDGSWGFENNGWCGILKTSTKTITTTTSTKTVPCPVYTFPYDQCTKNGGQVSRLTVNGCPHPTCILPSTTTTTTTTTQKISTKTIPTTTTRMPCPIYTFPYDQCTKNGGQVSRVTVNGCPRPTCILPSTTTTTTTTQKISTKTIPTTGISCPTYTVTYDLCMKNGGHISRVTVNGCPRPTCILPSTTTTTTTTTTQETSTETTPSDCWSESHGYPCCSDKNTEVIYSDKSGSWGFENNDWCGIPKASIKTTPTTSTKTVPCPVYTFPYDQCTKNGGQVSRITNNGCPRPTCILPSTTTTTTTQKISTKTIPTTTTRMPCPTYTFPYDQCTKNGGQASRVTVNGCPRPTCILPSTTTTTTQKTSTETTPSDCWSESLGYPCCSDKNTEVIYSDKDGSWGFENNDWCGIPKASTKTTSTTKKLCPAITFTYDQCSKRGGYVTSVTSSGCPTPTCIVEEKKCWSEEFGYPCCSPDNNKVIYVDKDGEWGNENSDWCGILRNMDEGNVTEKKCWSEEFGYPCCSPDNNKVIYVDKDGEWGNENGNWCGILTDIPTPTY